MPNNGARFPMEHFITPLLPSNRIAVAVKVQFLAPERRKELDIGQKCPLLARKILPLVYNLRIYKAQRMTGFLMSPKRKEPMGLYPNLSQHRTELGLTVPELLRAIPNPPSDKSVRRLERGIPIRLTTVNKIFNAVAKLEGMSELIREREIVVVEK